MPTKNYEQIKIWKSAHTYIKRVSEAYKARGDSSMSMNYLASQAILSIPMPNGSGHPNTCLCPVCGEEILVTETPCHICGDEKDMP
jgi:hypothetical protein